LPPKSTKLGADIAGRVEAVGVNVKQFQPGDEVFGDISGCGWGGSAEYVCAREDALVLKPVNLSFEEAAAVPLAAVTALQGLRDKGQIQPGQKVLINGASGKELLESGKVVPVIDRHYPLREAAEALRYLGAGHARGKVVISMA
jgi:NADPH:quinone reductase-like Zn-dependent oxidoreductase